MCIRNRRRPDIICWRRCRRCCCFFCCCCRCCCCRRCICCCWYWSPKGFAHALNGSLLLICLCRAWYRPRVRTSGPGFFSVFLYVILSGESHCRGDHWSPEKRTCNARPCKIPLRTGTSGRCPRHAEGFIISVGYICKLKRRAYALLCNLHYQRFTLPTPLFPPRLFLSSFLALLQSGHLWGSFSNPFSL